DININRNTNINTGDIGSGNRATQRNSAGNTSQKWQSGKQKGDVGRSVGSTGSTSRVGDANGGRGGASAGTADRGASRGGASAGTADRGGGGAGSGSGAGARGGGASAGTMDRGGSGGGGAFDSYGSGRSTQM